MFISRLIEAVRKGFPLKIQGKEGVRVNPIFVNDAVKAFSSAMELNGFHIINLAGPDVLHLRQIGEIIGKAVGRNPVFEMKNVSGTIVGFRCPAYVKGINVPGYHMHFLSNDFKQGGHVLDFITIEGIIDIDICNKFFLILPEEKSEFDHINLQVDRAGELEKVER